MFSSFLKVTSFYKDFLNQYYHAHPYISGKGFDEQYKHLMDQGYGYADYFPRYINKNYGIKAAEIIHNAWHLQRAWGSERGLRLSGDDLLMEQIRAFQPEVLFIQDSANFAPGFIERVRRKVNSIRLLIGHCCAPYTEGNVEAFRMFDVMLTCSEKFKGELGALGINCFLFPHAFESSLAQEIDPAADPVNDVVFIGSLLYRREFHEQRISVVEEILKNRIPFRIYGVIEEDPWYLLRMKQISYLLVNASLRIGLKGLQKNRYIRKIAQLKQCPQKNRYSRLIRENLRREMVFGKQMLKEIGRHAVGFNLHGEVAGDYAANVRMFEVTGAGALLVTDHKKNIDELFEPDREILTFHSVGECIEKLKWAIDHPSEAAVIAAAGRARTLKDHSVERRVDLLYEIIGENI